jgi:hypothetical protein
MKENNEGLNKTKRRKRIKKIIKRMKTKIE